MIRRFIGLSIFLVLSACTTLKTVDSPGREQLRTNLLAANEWEFRGRIAVRSDDGDGDGQANLRWRQLGERSHIRISGPFGAGTYEIDWSPKGITIESADGEESLEYAGSAAAESFLDDQLGWSFPAGSARYWMLGLIDPDQPGHEFFDAEGGLTGISQHGWQLGYKRFADVNGLVLPTRIEMANSNANLRIVIARWKLRLEPG
ncbi:MAG: outer membrane lipoprotein LolB [Chromatiales bacterium]|jgi:outer membrane lipoprotein LolB|nr:outer membrane lipoprotein LolB [Chromatiales bacterium]MDP6150715.1 lipoprotein insertase outer membrane protein LolB [Gammaproteobacteria bacterium]MDP7094392.1 lipoprotein insertase outer membrane protein LolB [Gammaproteobacteria bacterium]MDP7270181.1 lipoprotein insertase outer membrane protein LolB [Gammaproteobacteria bacterium]HJP05523.1 lipoprotein insertase outer membrane protein LolB [Gammaproteobacteria bacterium]